MTAWTVELKKLPTLVREWVTCRYLAIKVISCNITLITCIAKVAQRHKSVFLRREAVLCLVCT